MILKNRVIDVLENCESKPNWPPDKEGNPVIAVICDEKVERGFMYDPSTGAIKDPNAKPEPTQMDTIEESQLVIMEALAEQYELNEERHIDDLEIKAEIYEAILELGGNA
jgi:hypothetical protein